MPLVPRNAPRILVVERCAPAASAVLDRLIVGDISTVRCPHERYFDCVTFADVMEHLTDPWAVLDRAKTWLRDGGCVIASILNVQHWSTLTGLLRGQWEYRESGLMDRTHLRFFTRRSIIQAFAAAGNSSRVLSPSMGSLSRIVNRGTAGLFGGYSAAQNLIVATPGKALQEPKVSTP